MFFNSICALADTVTVYMDHVEDTGKQAKLSNSTMQICNAFEFKDQEQEASERPALRTGTLESFKEIFCKLHTHLAPLIDELSGNPFYSPVVVDFDKHATESSSLWGIEKLGITSKKYQIATAIRYARSKARSTILSHGLPFAVGYFQQVVPGRDGTVFALWRVPESVESRSDSRQSSAILHSSTNVRRILSRHCSRVYTKCIIEIGKSRGALKTASATALLEAFGFRTLTRTHADDVRGAIALTALLSSFWDTDGEQTSAGGQLAEDLRNYNCSKKGPLLAKFFEAARDFLDHSIGETGAHVDQRRAAEANGARMYMPIAMSLPDLRNKIEQHAESVMSLKKGVDFSLPSLEWLRLQFNPPRNDTLNAVKFSGLLGLHRALQTRTIRSDHEDSHFTRSLWQYIRHWCHPIASQGLATIFSVDDKCGVKIGEPGIPITALQGRRNNSICAAASGSVKEGTLAADHDYSAVTLTPSVSMFIEPPSDRHGSFARGAPYLTIKNAIFESSNPLRHAVNWRMLCGIGTVDPIYLQFLLCFPMADLTTGPTSTLYS